MAQQDDPASDPTAAVLAPGAQASPPDAFSVDEVLGGRFRVVRLIARGGMGEVFEAEDLELHERVALKTIRADLAAEPRFLDRFRREVQLARRVSHPNVCRTYDLEQHAAADGHRVTFLAMELVPGETLADRLAREGRLSTSDAWPIAQQMAAGLAAAHHAGVVHRDLKPGNALLTPGPPPRVVLTDFGLARSDVGVTAADLTDAGSTLGTAAYMAPEQVEGKPAGPPADIYALGIVLYEMVTGRKPFVGDTPLSTAVKRITEAPVPPSVHVPGLDAAWEKAILRCLQRDPSRRFARADDVARALPAPGAVASSRWVRPAAAALAVAGVAALALTAYLRVRSPAPVSPPAARPAVNVPSAPAELRRSVAVLGFRNLSGRPDSAWISTALAEMVGSELALGGKLRVIPGENVARMKAELALREAETLAPETVARVRGNLGADLVVTGTYLALGESAGGRLRLDVHLHHAASGEAGPSIIETASEPELPELVARVGAQLRERLQVEAPGALRSQAARAALPRSPEAARLYMEGLARLRVFDARGARDLLQRAALVEPSHPLVHAALAEAWGLLGYEVRRREAARKAYDARGGLGREETLQVEGRYHQAMRDWGKAAEIYRALWGFFPDDADHGLQLATVLRTGGQAAEAFAVLDALRKLPPPAGQDPRIDLAEAETAVAMGDHARGIAAAERAARGAAARGASLIVARARALQGWSTQMVGNPPRAQELLEESRRLYRQAGDKRGLAYAMHVTASTLDEAGDFDGARRLHEEVLALRRAIGDESGVAATLNNIAVALWDQDDLEGARRYWSASDAAYRRLGDRYASGIAVGNVAVVTKDLGDPLRARRILEEAIPERRAIDDRRSLVLMLGVHGQTLFALGDLDGARRDFAEMLDLCRGVEARFAAYALSGLGDVARAAGDPAEARRLHQEALAIRESTGAKLTAAESKVALSVLALDEGRADLASPLAGEAADAMQARRAPCKEATARSVLARALAPSDAAAARRELTRTADLLADCQGPLVRVAAAVHAARAEAVLGAPAGARSRLQEAVATAKAVGARGLELEARLAAAEIAPEGDRTMGLSAIAADARRIGHGRIARLAAPR